MTIDQTVCRGSGTACVFMLAATQPAVC